MKIPFLEESLGEYTRSNFGQTTIYRGVFAKMHLTFWIPNTSTIFMQFWYQQLPTLSCCVGLANSNYNSKKGCVGKIIILKKRKV
jgi:hypothetical protein